jgi:hypothetical protein
MVQSIVSKISEMFDIDGQKFASLLEQTGSIIAGSFPLAYLTEWSFTPNDMDVWIPFNKEDAFFEFLLEHCGFKKDVSKYYDNAFDGFEYRNTSLTHYVSSIKELVKNGKCIQLIILSEKMPNAKDVLKRFDYNICKVGYDGNNILVNDEVLEAIKRREVTIDYQESVVNTEVYQKYLNENDIKNFYDNAKYEKYVEELKKKKGGKSPVHDIIKFLNLEHHNKLEERQKALDMRRKQRKEKYEARGFKFVEA